MSGIEVYDGIVAADPGLADRFVLMSGDVLNPAIETFAAATASGCWPSRSTSRPSSGHPDPVSATSAGSATWTPPPGQPRG